ncbi:MAG: hypothetical protein M0Q88_04550 [Bacilli bacterium]|nr:hypothetical protein [Bacilli bacterium]
MVKRFYTLFIFIFFAFVLTACGTKDTEATGVAYGMTYNDYLTAATVEVKGEVVTSAALDEYYLPNTWAKVKVLETDAPADVLVSGSSWYGKFIKIGDKNFTASLREDPLEIGGVTYNNQVVKYSAEGVDDLFTWLRASEENRKWYVEQLDNNNAWVAKDDFSKSTYETAGQVDSNGKLGFSKGKTNYWKGDNFPLGWSGNMSELVKVVAGTKMDASMDQITQNDEKKWVVNGVVSGATYVSFKEYYSVLKTAYDKAVG